MSPANDCNQNADPLKLVREGTSQDQRLPPALNPSDPAWPRVDDRGVEHRVVFAQMYSKYLKYYDKNNTCVGDWQPFFSSDLSVLLAVAAVQDVSLYRQAVKEYSDFLNDRLHEQDKAGLRDRLDYLFSCCATLAIRFDLLKEGLPAEIALKITLKNLIQSRLAPALKQLIAYRGGGKDISVNSTEKLVNDSAKEKSAPLQLFGGEAVKFSELRYAGLSKDWTNNAIDWTTFYDSITPDKSAYGAGTTVFELINHIATHNLFTSILDQFLKAFARTVDEAKRELEKSFKEWDRHEPHYTLFLAFLRLFEFAGVEMNTLTGRHLDLYYREILKLKEKEAKPGQAHLLVELARQADRHELKTGELFKAGKDNLGRDAFFANNRNFVANQAIVAALKTVYRHKNTASNELLYQSNRLFASPIANSDDGLGAKLSSVDQSWHPFYNKIYKDGALAEIRMPQAEVGFAIASHYLLLAGGKRKVTVDFIPSVAGDFSNDVICLFSGKKGWIEKKPVMFAAKGQALHLEVELSGEDPEVVSYSAKKHGYDFVTDLPMLLVKLIHRDDKEYVYAQLGELIVSQADLTVEVTGLKDLTVSNDFGPVDTSKNFQPFGAQPVNGACFIIGAREVFQKKLESAAVVFAWQDTPAYYISKTLNVSTTAPTIAISHLTAGAWSDAVGSEAFTTTEYDVTTAANSTGVDAVDYLANVPLSLDSRHGFIRLVLKNDLGQKQYQIDLANFLAKIEPKPASHPGTPILGPVATAVSINYKARQSLSLTAGTKEDYNKKAALFFHLTPFGQSERHPFLTASKKVFLLPQFSFSRDGTAIPSEAEFYIGIKNLVPPQNLSLLFQVADGTADPLTTKPKPPDQHIHWSYLRGNEWISLKEHEIEDQTGGLLDSGIVTIAVPRDASDANTLLPAGMHWIRAAVASESDAVCRLRMVAAQALEATFTDKGNDPAFPAKVLQAGTISKLEQPDAAIKKIVQPFETFGGRGKEASTAFYTRISERLRHKDRAIALWDYERLVLEAFPQIYQVKCLNHTQYEPNEQGTGIYKELAPGHVTVVTIPELKGLSQRDPLRPYTSLGLLGKIESFLGKRLSCFVKLHVKNPRFEEVKVVCKVRLHDGFDKTYYENEFKKALTRFLSPWAFPGGGSPSFNGRIYKSVLINFVEDLHYVDYVSDFSLLHDGVEQAEVIEGSTAVSILVSARDHDILPINPAEVETPAGGKCVCSA